jgi:hypothetical protein
MRPFDSLSLAPKFLENVDKFFKLASELTNGKAFSFNMQSIKNLVSGEYFFSSWFEPRKLNWISEWIVAIFEKRVTLA